MNGEKVTMLNLTRVGGMLIWMHFEMCYLINNGC